jgi:hypothetical protein
MKWLLKYLNGSAFTFYIGGGSSAPAPTQQTVTQTNIPEYARPYYEDIMNRGTTVSNTQYQPYTGERVAGFSPLQEQAFQGIQNLGPSPLVSAGAGMTGIAGLGGLGAGQQYQQMATDPGAMAAYMSPYMQNVVDFQKSQAIRDYGRSLPGQQAAATRAGAFGGSRQAIVEAEAQRNLQNQLAGIQAQGSQSAFDQARQAQQFGANLGLQGLGLAGQMGAQFGQLGQTAFGQQASTAQLQQQAGAAQQAQQQDILNKRYEDFMQQTLYPQSQLQFLSSLLRGSVVSPQQTMYQYQAPPSAFNQLASAGLGAYGVGKLFGSKKGGEIKSYAQGGDVDGYAIGGSIANPQAQYELALRMPPERLQQIASGMPGPIEQGVALLVLNQKQQTKTAVEGEQAKDMLGRPTVKDQILGLAALPAGDISIPEGGITEAEDEEGMLAAAEGGVIRFQNRGEVPFLVSPELLQMYGFGKEAQNKKRQYQNEIASKAGERLPFPEAGFPDVKASPAFQPSSTGLYVLPEENPVLAPLEGLTNFSNTKTDTAKPRVRKPSADKGVSSLSRDVSPTAWQEEDRARQGIALLAPSTEAPAATETEDAMIQRFAEKAAGYMQEPREAFRRAQQTATAEREKELAGMREESKGVAALRAAAELSKSGRQGIESLGAAFGAAGEAGAAFGKEQRAALREKRASDLEAAKAEMAFKQGDYALGAQLMDKSEDRRLKAAKLAADKAYQEALRDLEGRKLGEIERHNRAEEKARLAYIGVLGSAYSARGQLTPSVMANVRDKANDNVTNMLKDPRTLLALKKQFPGATPEQLRALLVEQETSRLAGIGGAGGPAATPQFDLSKFGEPTVVGR